MIPPELINTGIAGGVGTAIGYLGKFWALNAERRHEEVKLLSLKADAQSKIYNEAIERVPFDAGKLVRRLIVGSVLFSMVLAPFVFAFFSDIPVVVSEEVRKGFFGRLFGPDTKLVFHEVNGFLIVQQILYAFTSFTGMYFGQGLAKGKRG